MTSIEERQKILFVGPKRICPQIAYVLDIPNYAMAEKLTAQNFDQYHDYQIYVCAFKRKSRGLVKREISRTATNIQYLDDICRNIDKGYDTKHHQGDGLSGVKVTLRNCQKQLRKGNVKLLKQSLQQMKPSELLLYVLRAKPNKHIQCTDLETKTSVTVSGDLIGCCAVLVPFGNLLRDGELDEIYHSAYARIVKLSSLNRSYCLCNLFRRCRGYCQHEKPLPTAQWQTPSIPGNLSLGFEQSCNLCCKTCRTKPYAIDDAARQQLDMIVKKLFRSGWLEQVNMLNMADQGEVFYSPYYRQLLLTDLQRKKISLKSNGTLFNEENWRLLDGKYSTVDVRISVDAATAETYQKLRGGDFNQLMHNLTMLGDLCRQKQIRKFGLNFVIQRDNFHEMPAFVRLGQALGVTHINFQRLNDWGTLPKQEFLKQCLIIDNKYLDYDLWCVLQDPLFKDPMVDLKGLQRYIDASERRYRRRYEREQRKSGYPNAAVK